MVVFDNLALKLYLI